MAGLSSFLALVVVATLWVVLRDEEYVAPSPRPAQAAVEPAAAASRLQELARAIADGDADAAAALAGAEDATAADRLAVLARNADRLGLVDVAMRYVDELGGLDQTGTWSATASVSWRIDGFDDQPASVEVRVDFRSVAGDVVVAGVGGRGGVTPVWLGGPVQVRRTADLVVVAARRIGAYAPLARQAVTVVRRVLPSWRDGLVVEVPRSSSAMDAALDVERGTFSNVAGVTAAADGSDAAAAPVHVFLNPDQLRSLRPAGAQVVVSHEAAHVALDAASSSLPVWLSEGFADYVALRDVGLPLTTTAAQVIRQVRREGPPERLPGDDEFDDDSEYFGAAYEAAWYACRLLADRVGERGLLGLYRTADGAADFDGLFRRRVGLGVPAFTQQWRDALSDLAG